MCVDTVIAVLSILVTVLIGWQIISYLTVEKRIRRIARKECKKEVAEIQTRFNALQFSTFFTLANNAVEQKIWGTAIFSITIALNGLRTMEKVDDIYTAISILITKTYNEGIVEKGYTNDLLTALEKNLGKYKDARLLMNFIESKIP